MKSDSVDRLDLVEPDWKYLAGRLFGELRALLAFAEDNGTAPRNLCAGVRQTCEMYEAMERPRFVIKGDAG